jgi:hypothetical protein
LSILVYNLIALSCLKYLIANKKIPADKIIVGIDDKIISEPTIGVDANLTIKTVGKKFKIPSNNVAFIKSGTKSIKVANTSARVIAELASLVLSTSMDMIIPTPMNPKPTNNNMKKRIIGL